MIDPQRKDHRCEERAPGGLFTISRVFSWQFFLCFQSLLQVDHIEPVVSPNDGFKDWNTFIARLFCEVDNLAVLCKVCHEKKTNEEKRIAKERRIVEKEIPRYENGQTIIDPKDIEKWHKLNDEPPKRCKHLKESENR